MVSKYAKYGKYGKYASRQGFKEDESLPSLYYMVRIPGDLGIWAWSLGIWAWSLGHLVKGRVLQHAEPGEVGGVPFKMTFKSD